MFGTNDALIYDEGSGVLEVIDLKGGQGKAVDAEENPQLMYYALGALLAHPAWGVTEVKLTIVQPRAVHRDGPIRSWSTTPFDLQMWAEKLKELAEATENPNAPLVAGPWCKFCPIEGTCPANKAQAIKAAMADFAAHPSDLSVAELASILTEASRIEDWIRAVRKYAFDRLNSGQPVDGFKLVAKRPRRVWAAPEFDIVATVMGLISVDENKLYKRELLSPTQMEKLVPKHLRADLAELVDKRSSGITVAPIHDKRAAVEPGTAQDDFEQVEE